MKYYVHPQAGYDNKRKKWTQIAHVQIGKDPIDPKTFKYRNQFKTKKAAIKMAAFNTVRYLVREENLNKKDIKICYPEDY